ncbi:MAG: hypothetical protein IPQ16_00940 [Geobacteraceae bacterium]|nr:hypothetical protein [Geobacteraceae bacterium]
MSELIEMWVNGGDAADLRGLGEGINSEAFAVKEYTGYVIGAITMPGPSFRFLKELIDKEIIPLFVEGAARESEKF